MRAVRSAAAKDFDSVPAMGYVQDELVRLVLFEISH